MATTTIIDQSYIGDVAGKIFTKAYLEQYSLKSGIVEVVPFAGLSAFLRKTLVNGVFVNYSCGFNPSGSIDLTDKEVTPKKLKMELEICKEDFRRTWSAYQMGFSAWNNEIPADEKEAIMIDIRRNISEFLEEQIWNGVTGNGTFQGILTEAEADADVVKVDGVAITAANVEAEMLKLINATPLAIRKHRNFRIVVSNDVLLAYLGALDNAYYKRDNAYYLGYKIDVLDNLPANTMLAFVLGNLKFITGLESDFNEIRVKDMDESDLSGTIRIKVVLSGIATYVDGSELVVYRIDE